MLRGIPLLFLMVSGLSVFLSCKGPASNSTATVTVTFEAKAEHGTLKAKAGDTELTSGASVKKGTEITFTADPKAGYEVDYWEINKAKKSGTHKTETVKADKDLTVTVIFKTIGYPSTKIFTIQFKSSKMKCRKNGGGDINPGDTVHENDRLNFDAKLTEGNIVDKWTINGTPKDDATENSFSYVVMASDEQDGSITIGYTDKKATEAKIQFDSPNITCTKNGGASISSGDTVHENDILTFTATLPEGEIVDKRLINDKNKGNATYFQYTVKIEDAQNGIIHVKKEKIGKWTVNGAEKKKEGDLRYFSYTIKADDDGKTLTVAYTEK